jgi:hypothetical protein
MQWNLHRNLAGEPSRRGARPRSVPNLLSASWHRWGFNPFLFVSTLLDQSMSSPASSPRRDQAFLDQPSFFGGTNPSPDAFLVDHGKRSRDEQYSRIVDDLTEKERTWYSRIVMAGVNGITLDELASRYKVPQNAFSGRITGLKKAGLVRHTKERRPTSSGGTAAVIVATEFLVTDQPSLPSQPSAAAPPAETERQTVVPPSDNSMLGDLNRDEPPVDQDGNPMTSGNRYVIDSQLFFCFEADDGELLVQRCTSDGKARPNHAPRRVLEMNDGTYTVHRVK